MSDNNQIRKTIKVADKLAQVSMKHNYVLLQKVVQEESDERFADLIPDNMKEFRLQVVSVGPGSLLSDDKAPGGWVRAPMSVKVGDVVQFHGNMIPIRVGEEEMAVILDTQVYLSVEGSGVH